MTFENKAILVTGGAKGLGFAISRRLVELGADVVICGRDYAALLIAKQALHLLRPSRTAKVHVIPCDVSNESDVRSLFETIVEFVPNFCGLVNNAAILGPIGLTHEVPLPHWQHTIQVNLIGTMLMCQCAINTFSGFGHIVNLSGGGATSPRPLFSAYAASKAAVVRFTETLALEMAGKLTVNAIAPGPIDTEMYREASKVEKAKEPVSMQSAVELCCYLLSDESNHINGKLLSAVWDNWPAIVIAPEADKFTLRRIS